MIGTAAEDTIAIFGDSHAKFFFDTPFFVGRQGLRLPLAFRVKGEFISASSVAGFRPGVSKLKVKDQIAAALPGTRRLVLAFGQVDLELGYYYRLAVKRETVDPDGYVDWLARIYEDFLNGLRLSGIDVALKGVNLTALSPRPFAIRYVARIVTEGTGKKPIEGDHLIEPHILSEDDQNRMHLAFNDRLKAIAAKNGHRYFDIVQETGNGGIPGLTSFPLRLSEEFQPGFFDHHLADTVRVRRIHHTALARTFGFV